MFNNKNDPLVGSVQKVMKENEMRRACVKALHEELGIVDRKQLVNEDQSMYDSVLAEIIKETLGNDEVQLSELSKDKLRQYASKAGDDYHDKSSSSFKKRDAGDVEGSQKDYDTSLKRHDGRKQAIKKLAGIAKVNAKEEVVNEVSKGKLNTYVKKAYADQSAKLDKADYLQYMRPSKSKGREVANKLIKKAVKRDDGINTAVNKLTGHAKVNAAEETINEISKDKKTSYLRAALNDIRYQRGKQADAILGGKTDAAKKLSRKVQNRKDGINRAVAEENINEISKEKTTEYLKAAQKSRQAQFKRGPFGYTTTPESRKVIRKRDRGFDLAAKKLAEEETINELSVNKVRDYIAKSKESQQSTRKSIDRLDRKADTPQSYTSKKDWSDYGGRGEMHKTLSNRKAGQKVATKKLVGNAKVAATVEEGMSKDELRALIAQATNGVQATKVPAGANSGIKGSAWRKANETGKKIAIRKAVLNDPKDLAPSATFKGTHTGKRKNLQEFIESSKKNLNEGVTSDGYRLYKKKVHTVDPSKADGIQKKGETDREFAIRNKLKRPPGKADFFPKTVKEETVNELHRNTLKSYIKKASEKISKNVVNNDYDKATKRAKGLVNATKKLDGKSNVGAQHSYGVKKKWEPGPYASKAKNYMDESNLNELTGKGALEKIRRAHDDQGVEHGKKVFYRKPGLSYAGTPEGKADSEKNIKAMGDQEKSFAKSRRAGLLIRKRGELKNTGKSSPETNDAIKRNKSYIKNMSSIQELCKKKLEEVHVPHKHTHSGTLGATDTRQEVRDKNSNQATKGGQRYNVTQKENVVPKKKTEINFDPESKTLNGY
jgi:hypothetical protein